MESRSHVRSRARQAHARLPAQVVVLVFVVALGAAAAPAAPRAGANGDPTHAVVIDGPAGLRDWAYAVVADDTGCYVGGFVARTSHNRDASLAKVSPSGELEWLKTYHGPSHRQDRIVALAKGPNGTIYGAGAAWTAHHGSDMLLLKWRTNGTLLWARTYDFAHRNDMAAALGVDGRGNVVVAGVVYDANDSGHRAVVRWTAGGKRTGVWRARAAGSWDDQTGVVVRSDGTAYVSSSTARRGSPGGVAALTLKFSPSGALVWRRVYAGPNGLGANPSAITARPGGGVYVAGQTRGGADPDGFVVRYAGSGATRVLPSAGLADSVGFWDVAVTTSGDVVAVGWEGSSVGDSTGCVRVWASEAAESTSADGVEQAGDEFLTVAADSSGGFVAAGGLDEPSEGRFLVHHGDPAAGGSRIEWPAVSGFAGCARDVAVAGTTAYVVGTGLLDRAHGEDQVVLICRE